MAALAFTSLRTRLLLLVLVAVVPFILVSVNENLGERRNAIDETNARALAAVAELARETERLLTNTRRYLEQMALHPSLVEHDTQPCNDLFATIVGQDERFSTFALVDRNGTVHCAHPSTDNDHHTLVDAVLAMPLDATALFAVGSFTIDITTGEPFVPLAIPFLTHHRQTPSVLAVGLDLDAFHALLNVDHFPSDSAVSVIDRGGTILARLPEHQRWRGQIAVDPEYLTRLLTSAPGVIERRGVDEVSRHYAYATIGPSGADLLVSVAFSVEASLTAINRMLIRDLVMLFLIALVAGTALWLAGTRMLLNPIRRLAEAARAVRDGQLDVRLGFNADDGEFADLGADFEAMIERLSQRTRALESRTRELTERVKETTCLQGVLTVCSDRKLSESAMLTTIANLLPAGFQFPEQTRAWVECDGTLYGECPDSPSTHENRISYPVDTDGKEHCRLVVAVTPIAATPVGTPEADCFLEEEHQLLKNIAKEISRALAYRRIDTHLALLERAIGAVSEGVVITDHQADDEPVVYVNPTFAAMTGYSIDDVIGRNCRMLQGADTDREIVGAIHKALDEQRSIEVDILNYRRDGTPFWNALSLSPITDREGRVTHFVGIQRDVTEMHNTRQRIDILATAVESAQSAVIVTDTHGVILYVNGGFERTTGYSADEAVGETPRLLRSGMHGEQFYEYLWSEISTGRPWRSEIINRRKDGTLYTAMQSITAVRNSRDQIVRFVAIQDDMTELREAEQMLWQAQRMDAIGQLTGGVAHDFNNLLTVILGNLEALDDIIDRDSPAHDMVTMSRTAGERAAELTRRLLAFARKQSLHPQTFDLAKQVQSLHPMLKRLLGEQNDTRLSIEENLPAVHADPAQVESALLNLAINARDAMPDGGLLAIGVHEREINAEYANIHDLTVGHYVVLEVSDTGTGMSADVLARAHEPFYTTKEPGKGTGLGLSMVYGFARQSGGHLQIYSDAGEGTTVRLYLPSRPATTDTLAAPRLADDALPGGNETVLVVEDEDLVRTYVVGQLRELGYNVLETGDSAAALEILKSDQAIDLLFTDIVLPGGMNGREVAAAARKLRPALRVLFTSGYSEDVITRGGELPAATALLSKPYQRQQLALRLRQLLDAPPLPDALANAAE